MYNPDNILKTIYENQKSSNKFFIPSIKGLPEIIPSQYWLICGIPGTGKTSLMDKLFMLDPILEGRDFLIIYRSMERPARLTYAKWLAYIIWRKEGILYDVKTMLQYGSRTHTFSEVELEMVKHYVAWMKEQFNERVFTYSDRATVADIRKTYMAAYHKYKGKKEFIIHLTDHLDKVKGVRGQQGYERTAEYTDTIAELRDKTEGVFCDIVQLRTSKVMETNRRKLFGAEATLSDLYMGEKVAQNIDTGIAIIHPKKLSQPMYHSYSVDDFVPDIGQDSTFRAVSIMKSSFGIEKTIPANFVGQVGDFEVLPPFTEIKNFDYYTKPHLRKQNANEKKWELI